jgi:hypothetical protein
MPQHAAPRLLQSSAPEDLLARLAYDRPAEFEAIEFQVLVPTRDGTRPAGRLFRPGGDAQPDE